MFCYVGLNFDVLRIILKLPRVTAIKNFHEQTGMMMIIIIIGSTTLGGPWPPLEVS
jgi:hypothetical protein